MNKSFGGVNAVQDVSLTISEGEIVAIVGENGAGKSTLLKILCGALSPDSGKLHIQEQEAEFHSIHDALQRGVAHIPQELELCETMTVEENLLLGREPTHRWGILQNDEARSMAQRSLDQLSLDFCLDDSVASLGHGHRQLLSIVRSLDTDARVLLLDEPTATLSPAETETLLECLRDLRSRGGALVLITHRLAEVESVADRVIVLRDGKHVATLTGDEIERTTMVRHMVGRDLVPSSFADRSPGKPQLILENVTTKKHPNPISLQVRKGECVALAGLVGSGRSELLEAIFGLRPRQGRVQVGTKLLLPEDPAQAVEEGVCLIPEERSSQGLSLQQSVAENAALPGLNRVAGKAGVLSKGAISEIGERVVTSFNVQSADLHSPIRELSGGNQQKVVIGKWVDLEPEVLLLDEPTRGVDVGAREEIHQRLREYTAAGKAILFASSELEEVLAISDRIWVMAEGKFMGELSAAEATEEQIMGLATERGAP